MNINLKKIMMLMGLTMTATVAIAATTGGLSEQQKKQVNTQIHDYLLAHPETVVQSLQKFQQKQMDQAQKTIQKTQELAPKYAASLFRNANDPVIGNPNGKVTVVEFFDYQCPHCLRMQPVFEAIIKENPEVRIVYKEFPIRGPVSETAARAALAAQNQGKYEALHNALMKTEQLPLTEDMIFDMAKTAGLDLNKLKADMNSSAVSNAIKANMQLGRQLQLLGTPAIFVARSDVKQGSSPMEIAFIPGQADQSQLRDIIKQVQ